MYPLHIYRSRLYLAGVFVLTIAILLASLLTPATPALAQDAPAAPNDTPEDVVTEPYDSFYLTNGLLYWDFHCIEVPGAPGDPDVHGAAAVNYLRRKPVNGGFQTTLATPDATHCKTYWGLFADADGVYYYSSDDDRIEFRPSGSPYDPANVLLDDVPNDKEPFSDGVSRMATDPDNVYWVGNANAVYRVAKDGTSPAPVLVASGLSNPNDILFVGQALYIAATNGVWRIDKDISANNPSPANCNLTVANHRLSANGGTGLVPRLALALPPAPSALQIFWAAGNRIRLLNCPLGSATCSESIVHTAPNDGNPWEVGAPAFAGNIMFWEEGYSVFGGDSDGALRRTVLGSGNVQTIAPNISSSPGMVFVDGNYVYYGDTNFPNYAIRRLPLDATAIVRDLKADKWEVTQGIQNTANAAPLVAHKPTFVRAYGVHLNGPPANGVNARLFGTRGGNPLPGSPLNSVNGTRTLQEGVPYDRGVLDDGWLFKLPDSWTSNGATALQLVVDPLQTFEDPDRTNNVLNTTVSFQDQPPACPIYIPVRTHDPLPSVDDANFWDMVGRFERLWPIPDTWNYVQGEPVEELQVCWWGPFPYPCFGPYEMDEGFSVFNGPADSDKVIISMMARVIFSDDPDECDDAGASVHYMGMVHPSAATGKTGGYANYVVHASWVKLPPHSPDPFPNEWNAIRPASTMAQELTHNFYRLHVNCGKPSDLDNSYPYPPCQLDNVGPDAYFGFDYPSQTPITPTMAADYMSYAGNRWVSDYTWRAVLDDFAASATAAPAAPDLTALVSVSGTVEASGYIDTKANVGQLNYVNVLPDGTLSAGMAEKFMQFLAPAYQPVDAAQASQPVTVTYKLRLLDAQGTPLTTQVLDLTPQDDHELGTEGNVFIATFPAPTGQVAKIQLLADDTVLDELTPGIQLPQVAISTPAGGETVQDKLTITWQASDPDHDPLLFTIQYSYDNGGHWQALINDFPGKPDPNYEVELTNLSSLHGSNGASALIRILASDGYNTTPAQSQPFTLANRKPLVYIMNPAAGQVYDPQQAIIVNGGATDAEDGGLVGGSLTWKLNGTEVATGTDAALTGLAPGVYSATLTATDSAANAATAAAALTIAPLSIPLGASPAMDGFCNDAGYGAGSQVSLAPYASGDQATVHLVRDAGYLWACFTGLAKGDGDPIARAGLRVDVNNNRADPAQADDYAFLVGEDGGHITYAGNAAGGFEDPGPGGLQAQISADVNENGPATTWSAELRIDLSVLGGPNRLVGMTAGHYSLNDAGNDFVWPYAAAPTLPSTWGTTALGPLPIVTGINPFSAQVGDPSFLLQVDGSHFSSDVVLLWNDTPISPTVSSAAIASSTSFSVSIPANLLTTPGQATVVIRNPGPLDSSPVAFVVNDPAPVITTLSPDQKGAQAPGFTLTVTGTGFLSGAKVVWEGQELPTTFSSATELTAQVAAGLLALGGQANVTVRNPAPVADSNAVPFEIVPVQMWLPSLNHIEP